MSKEQLIAKLEELAKHWDPASAHEDADKLICEFLTSLGHADVVAAYDTINKWFE